MANLVPVLRPKTRLARWDPWRDLEEVHDRLGRFLERAFEDLELPVGIWSPVVDVEETDDAWIVEAELPGVKREDVTVEMTDGELAIHGEIRERERKGVLRRRSRRTGRFDYRMTLPAGVEADKIEAHLDSGVLTVRLPKSPQTRARRIEVKGS